MKAKQLREKYFEFFKEKGHSIINSAPVVPENDPSSLFTSAGMQPLVPYLLGEIHPSGKRIVDYQKCIRTDDIDEVGDISHLTFFEMLGNWSLGDYFKEESIAYSYEFLTKVLNIPNEKISVTVFAGDDDCPKDIISFEAWKKAGISEDRIYFFDKKENWWGLAGKPGPCGPDTEIFYDTGKEKCSISCNPSCDCGKYIEIWNNVFMEYNKTEDGKYLPLKQKNVDTGMGLERVIFILQGKENVFQTELFTAMIEVINKYAKNPNENSIRIIVDHLRTSSFILIDKILPKNTDQGYILRRLIRRMIRHMRKIEFDTVYIEELVESLVNSSMDMYPQLYENKEVITAEIKKEIVRFEKTLVNGEKEFNKIINNLKEHNIVRLNGKTVFRLYDTFGFPPELTLELANESNMECDIEGFNKLFEEHQVKSREGAEQKFKGGLADTSIQTVKYHTAAHLLLESLRKVLGDHVYQRGSNLTSERLRFDFSHPQKLTDEEKQKIENMVNEQIKKELEVKIEEMSVENAKKNGATGVFDDKYADIVKVYTIGDFSKEICGGPHVDNIKVLGKFKIIKEEAVSSGTRRIKAVLED